MALATRLRLDGGFGMNSLTSAGTGSAGPLPAGLGCLPGADVPDLIGLVTGTSGETM